MSDQPPSHVQQRYSRIPMEMRHAKRWLLYRLESRPGKKPSKVPYYVSGRRRSGQLDSPEDLNKLVFFEDAIHALERGDYAGLGFALGPEVMAAIGRASTSTNSASDLTFKPWSMTYLATLSLALQAMEFMPLDTANPSTPLALPSWMASKCIPPGDSSR